MEQEQQSQESPKGQMIYLYKAKIGWRKKRGNGYINNYKDIEFVSRASTLEMMNENPEFMIELMASHGLTGSSISNVGVVKIYEVKEISRSFYHKEE